MSTTEPLSTDDLRAKFDAAPMDHHVRAFGVDYIKHTDTRGGELYITRYGWPWARYLMPEQWYTEQQYRTKGQRLTGGTGTVYRMKCSPPGSPRVELVVKFSRFAEHVPLFMPSTLPDDLPGYLAEIARFNSPFEEFALLEDLRLGRFGPPELRILTKRALAIYCTPSHLELWQLGRKERLFMEHERELQQDQATLTEEEKVHLEIDRQYAMLFGWAAGDNAEDLLLDNVLGKDEVEALSHRVHTELALKGFRILDNKPKHFILRRRKDGSVIRKRDGQLVYVQVDFELLQRTEEYLAAMKYATAARSTRY